MVMWLGGENKEGGAEGGLDGWTWACKDRWVGLGYGRGMRL